MLEAQPHQLFLGVQHHPEHLLREVVPSSLTIFPSLLINKFIFDLAFYARLLLHTVYWQKHST